MLTLTDWRELSACRDSDPEVFFPIGTTGPAVGHIEKARAICGACSVGEECLQYALETNQESGVWGGYPEGVSFAILLMNAAVPLIDKYTKPTKFGFQKLTDAEEGGK